MRSPLAIIDRHRGKANASHDDAKVAPLGQPSKFWGCNFASIYLSIYLQLTRLISLQKQKQLLFYINTVRLLNAVLRVMPIGLANAPCVYILGNRSISVLRTRPYRLCPPTRHRLEDLKRDESRFYSNSVEYRHTKAVLNINS